MQANRTALIPRLALALVTLVLLGVSAFGETPDEQEARAFLDRFPHIRLYVARAPGNGHQASSINILRRVRELGYRGTVEVVYDEDASYQLERLLPGFDPEGAHTQRLSENLIATRHTPFRPSPPLGRVGLAITGGQDQDPEDVIKDLQADLFLRLNPHEWEEGSFLVYAPEGGGIEKARLRPIESMHHRLRAPTPAEIPRFLEEHMTGSLFAPKRAGLQTILSRLSGQAPGTHSEWEFAPAYGLNRNGDEKYLRNYLHALREAFVQHPDRFRSRGAIIPVLSDLTPARRDMLELLIHGLNQQRTGGPLVELHEVSEGAALETMFDAQPEAPARRSWFRRRLPPDSRRIHVVLVDNVPRDVFDYVFSQATIPVLAEGKQTVNLLRSLGIPFLDTYVREHYRTDTPGAKRLHDASEALQHYGAFDGNAAPVIAYLTDAKDPDSELSRYTREVQAHTTAIENDMVVQGLRVAARVAESHHPSAELEHIKSLKGAVCLRRYLELGSADATPALPR